MAHFVVAHQNLPDYPGMVLHIGLTGWNPDDPASSVDLNLEWMCLGLDLYGDTLQESCIYRFPDLNTAKKYIEAKFGIPEADIQPGYRFDPGAFPDPIKDSDKKDIYEAAWQRFREDFRKGMFLDPEADCVYQSVGPANA